jgi:hypothetical protein
MKFLNFFCTFVGLFCPPGSGPTDLIESGSEKHWFMQTKPTYCPLILGVQAAT